MKIFNKKIVTVFCLASAVLVQTSCKKTLDINQNPNFPTLDQGNASLVFPAAVLATTGKVGGDLAIVGGIFSQYFTQSTLSQQYTDIESYNLASSNAYVNRSYDLLFSNGLKNYQYVISKAQAAGDWNFNLLGTVMKAYTTEVLVDLYDQIPYTEGLQGSNNLQPHFDDGKSIYKKLIASIDSALAKDFSASSNTDPGTSDIIFGGNIDNWKKFANTLKLKMYIRMSGVEPTYAAAGYASLIASNAQFLDVDASVTNFTDNPSLDNPMYEQNIRSLNTTSNLKASKTFVSWLIGNVDSRITKFYGSSNPSSIDQGNYTTNTPTYQAAPVFIQKATDPVVFISLAETEFLLAEAELKFNGGGAAQTHYENGVKQAFSDLGLTGDSYVAVGGAYEYPAAGTNDQKLEAIIVQKWASCIYGCHGIEAWFEKSRTGYPKSSPVYSTDPSYVAGQLVVGANSVLPGATDVPKRFVFPYDETSRNSNAPTPVPSTTKVWWGL